MSTTSRFSGCPASEAGDRLKIRVYRVRLTARAQRFAAKVDASGGPDACWPWTAYRQKGGTSYGTFLTGSRKDGTRRLRLAHVVAYELAVGPVPEGLEIRHLCGNSACCNPGHMVPGTHRQNIDDIMAMGRTTAGERHPLAKLTADAIPVIRQRKASGETAKAIAADYGVHPSRIYQVARGDGWRHVQLAREARP